MQRAFNLSAIALLILVSLWCLVTCEGTSNKEMAKRSVARNELERAHMIYLDFCKEKHQPPLTKAELAAFNPNYPPLVDYFPNGYPDIKWGILARSWENKVMLVNERGQAYILEKCLSF